MLEFTPIGASHVADLVALGGDDPDRPWRTSREQKPLQSVKAFVVQAQRLRARRAADTFAVHDTGRLVGVVTLTRIPSAPDSAELGYWIGPALRGRGYATAAARQLVTRCFGSMRLDLVVAYCPDANRASARVLGKLGFRAVASSNDPRRRYELRPP